jgi:hypothetical protein
MLNQHFTDNSARIGRYMHVASGGKYWPFDPRPEEIDIETIAHHLAMKVRYNGAVKDYYSVAEHSVYVSYEVPPEHTLEGLLHDGSEAYNGDLIRPLKYDASFREPFQRVEKLNERALAQRFGLIYPFPASVKIADEMVTAAEFHQIVIRNEDEEWDSGKLHDDSKIANISIQCLDWKKAKNLFLDRFHWLMCIRK